MRPLCSPGEYCAAVMLIVVVLALASLAVDAIERRCKRTKAERMLDAQAEADEHLAMMHDQEV
jgi:hypothetical protein